MPPSSITFAVLTNTILVLSACFADWSADDGACPWEPELLRVMHYIHRGLQNKRNQRGHVTPEQYLRDKFHEELRHGFGTPRLATAGGAMLMCCAC